MNPLNNDWIDCGHYWLNTAKQLSSRWHEVRRGRPTASMFLSCIGEAKEFSNLSIRGSHGVRDSYNTDLIAEMVAGLRDPQITEDRIDNGYKHGIVTEAKARHWYSQKYNVDVRELGLAVPKWDLRIGASVDGDIVGTEGIIEIKCPLKMYPNLNDYMDKVDHGWFPPPDYYGHIWLSHYSQMQGCMAVLGKKWCDYVVFCTPENRVFTQRIYFNADYWNNSLYPKLNNFIITKLQPLLRDGIYPIMPPKHLQ